MCETNVFNDMYADSNLIASGLECSNCGPAAQTNNTVQSKSGLDITLDALFSKSVDQFLAQRKQEPVVLYEPSPRSRSGGQDGLKICERKWDAKVLYDRFVLHPIPGDYFSYISSSSSQVQVPQNLWIR